MQTACRGSQLGCIDKKIPVFECEQTGKRKGRTWNAMCVQAQPGMRWQKTSASDAGAKTAHPITMRCASWERQLAAGKRWQKRYPLKMGLPGSEEIRFLFCSMIFSFEYPISTRVCNAEKWALISCFLHRKRELDLDVSFLSSKFRPLSIFNNVEGGDIITKKEVFWWKSVKYLTSIKRSMN